MKTEPAAALSSEKSGLTTLKTIRRESLRDIAVREIRAAIERGDFSAGEQITELGLAKRLGVAQPTIREALLELEFTGFIERLGPKKTCVTSLTREKIDEIYLVRSRLEVLAAEILAGMETPDLRACEDRAAEMLKAARAGNVVQFFQADLDFHRSLWEASGNATLREILERIVPKLFAFSTIKHSRPTKEKLASIATQHAGIIGHIRARDMKAVRREMAASMERAWQDDVELP